MTVLHRDFPKGSPVFLGNSLLMFIQLFEDNTRIENTGEGVRSFEAVFGV